MKNYDHPDYAQSLERLIAIVEELRVKCPWDKKQTIHSLRQQSVEELYELSDAIINEDWKGIKEELGDLLLHLIFYSKIGSEQKEFNFQEVIEGVSNKLVSRHPHVYGNSIVDNEEDVKKNWEQLKLKEGKKSILSGVPESFPPMSKSLSVQNKVKQVGFEFPNIKEVKGKVKEEWDELEEAIQMNDKTAIKEEFGDLMFSLINYARFLDINPEEALEQTNKKFIFRFKEIEKSAKSQNKSLTDLSLEDM